MGTPREEIVCMAPGVVLTRPDASTMGNVVEQLILRDYLKDTSFPPPPLFGPPIETPENWWDVGSKPHYLKMLLKRHPEIIEQQLGNLGEIRIPDLSTWQGRYLRGGQPVAGPDGQRSELYEIKPDSVWGEASGREKIRIIHKNYTDLALSGYKWGSWYPYPPGPKGARKELEFRHYEFVMRSLRYRWDRMQRSLRNINRTLLIRGAKIHIERRPDELGLLYYLICAHMRLDFKGEDKVAKKVIQRVFEAMTTGMSKQQAEITLQFANSLVPMGPDRKPLLPKPEEPETREALRALAAEEEFRIGALNIIAELRGAISSLGQTLFSRLRGLPGDRFIVCSDEVYFNNEIVRPRQMAYARQVARQIATLQQRPPVIIQYHVGAAGGLVKVIAPVLATVKVIGRLALRAIYGTLTLEDIFTAKDEWLKAQHWLEQHPEFTLIVGSALIYGTAIVLASGGAVGALALYGEGAVVAVEGLGIQSGLGLARSLASGELSSAALPAVEQQIAARFPIEAAQRIAAMEADELLTRQLSTMAQQQMERIIARQAAAQLRQGVVQKTLAAGGVTLAGVAVQMALGVGPGDALNEASVSSAPPVAMEVGSLFLLQLKDNFPLKDLPLLEEQFDYTRFSFDVPGPLALPQEITGVAVTRPKKLRYLGVLECS